MLLTLGRRHLSKKVFLLLPGSGKICLSGCSYDLRRRISGRMEVRRNPYSKLIFIGKTWIKLPSKKFRECLYIPENEPRIAAMLKVQLHDRIGKQLLVLHIMTMFVQSIPPQRRADINWEMLSRQTASHRVSLGQFLCGTGTYRNGVDVNRVNGERLGKQTPLHMLAGRTTNLANRLACAKACVKAGAQSKSDR